MSCRVYSMQNKNGNNSKKKKNHMSQSEQTARSIAFGQAGGQTGRWVGPRRDVGGKLAGCSIRVQGRISRQEPR